MKLYEVYYRGDKAVVVEHEVTVKENTIFFKEAIEIGETGRNYLDVDELGVDVSDGLAQYVQIFSNIRILAIDTALDLISERTVYHQEITDNTADAWLAIRGLVKQ